MSLAEQLASIRDDAPVGQFAGFARTAAKEVLSDGAS